MPAKLCDVEVIPTVCVESLASLKAASLTCALQQILVGVKEGEINVYEFSLLWCAQGSFGDRVTMSVSQIPSQISKTMPPKATNSPNFGPPNQTLFPVLLLRSDFNGPKDVAI